MFSFLVLLFGIFGLGLLSGKVYLGVFQGICLICFNNKNILFMGDFTYRYGACFFLQLHGLFG
jgi:hypothetical protein